MKILHLIPTLNKGGAERIALDMCLELARQGHEVKVVALHPENQYEFLTQSLDYTVVETRVELSLWRKNRTDVRALQAVIDAFQPDVIHSHLFEAEINSAFCRLPQHTKRVVHFHDNMVQMKRFSWRVFTSKRLLANFYERSLVLKNLPTKTHAIAISDDTFRYATQVLPRSVQIIRQLNAIDLRRFTPLKEQITTQKITMIGSLVEKKGHDLAIAALAELKRRAVFVQLQVLGSGPKLDALQRLVDELGIRDYVVFHGNQDFPEVFLQNSLMYLHTASYEPFGLVLIEAMACGLPVVCTDGYGNRELIHEGENGFMIWERDPLLIADKIQFLLENDAELSRMGDNAHRFAQQFGMEAYVNRLLEIYRDL